MYKEGVSRIITKYVMACLKGNITYVYEIRHDILEKTSTNTPPQKCLLCKYLLPSNSENTVSLERTLI